MLTAPGPNKSLPRITSTTLHRALCKNEIIPFFQPIVKLHSGDLGGFEVLARWKHPVLGYVPPDRFIGIAEKSGLIDLLTGKMLEQAFSAVSSLDPSLTLSVNISPVQLRTPELADLIRSTAASSGFALNRLVVEITESALIGNVDTALTIAKELKAMGCKISLDDFGTGYSSLFHLQSLPFDELKVDRSFVGSMSLKRESRKIVGAVVGLGQSLGLKTVAEGIETEDQAEMLLWLGCELGQGWLFGKPVPAEQLAEVIRNPVWHLPAKASLIGDQRHTVAFEAPPTHRLVELQALYNGAPIGLAFVDQDLRYVNVNRKLADMNGVSIKDHLGRRIRDVVPELFPQIEMYLLRALRGESISEVEVPLPHSRGTRTLCYEPARDEAGEIVGVSIASSDFLTKKHSQYEYAVAGD